MANKRLRQRTGTVAVGAIAIIVVFMIVLTCIGIVVMESNQYNTGVKYANEAVATKAKESLAVVQASSTLVNITNEGSTPVVIIGFYLVNPADNSTNYVPLSITVPLLSSLPIMLPQPIPENWSVGVVTSLGNVFWEETPVQGGAVPPGQPVYITFAAQGLSSDASGTVLTVDGSAYTYSQLPKTFQWVSNSTHSFSWSSPVSGSSGVRYVWASTSGLSTKQSDSSFTVNTNGYVIATYRTQYSLTMNVNPSGGGTTNPAPGTYWYDPGSTVQISAAASSDYVFSSWTGSGSGSYSGTATPASVTVNGSITETANFAPLPVTVTFTVSGLSSDASGTVLTVDGSGYSYIQLPISFTWTIGSSHSFTWSDPISAGSGKQYAWVSTSGLSTAKSGTMTVPSGGGTVSATYKTQYYLTVSSAYDSPTPTSGWFDAGTSVTASVSSPVSGGSGVQYVCTGWSGSGSAPSSGTGTSVTFTINAPSSITWNWKTQYYLTMQASPSGGGSVSPSSGWYDSGSSVPISASAASGYVFSSWTGSGSGSYSGTANPATITMNGPITETAVFSLRPWLTGWSYRRPITITSTLSLSNYQILIQVDTASLISAGKMRSDGGDIRFTDSDGVTLLSYWIEPGTINTANTRIWVKAPSIPSGTKTAYVYYGNPSATSQSNGDNTFLLFDDFLGTTLNTSKWGVSYFADPNYGAGTASYSVANGELVLYAPAGSYRAIVVTSLQTFGQSEIRMKVYPSRFATYNDVYLWGAVYSLSDFGTHLWDRGYAWDVDDYNNHRFEYYSSSLSYVSAFIDTNYHVYFAKYIPGSQIVKGYDTTTESTITTNIPNTANNAVFFECGAPHCCSSTDQYLHIDWVFVKNYASSEPSVALGSEET